jgi:hypothetical protein
MTRTILGAFLLSAASGLLVSAAPSPQAEGKEAKVRRLMELTGAGNIGKQTLDAMMEQFRRSPDLPPGFVEKFKAAAKPDDIVNLVVPVYMKLLDEATIDAAIAFHASEAGRKLSQAQPAIMKESMEAGARWGQETALKVLRELEKDNDK